MIGEIIDGLFRCVRTRCGGKKKQRDDNMGDRLTSEYVDQNRDITNCSSETCRSGWCCWLVLSKQKLLEQVEKERGLFSVLYSTSCFQGWYAFFPSQVCENTTFAQIFWPDVSTSKGRGLAKPAKWGGLREAL
jgi:hypothetical protein